MTVQPGDPGIEYRFLKFNTHSEAEEALNQAVAEGWQLVAYQAAGMEGSGGILHFLVISRTAKSEGRRFGFGA
jgi:hypothetical protein